MKNKKLLICGSYGAKNIGDELILLGIKSLFEGNEITVLSESKENNHFSKFPAGITSFIKFLKNRDNLKALKDCDYFLLGGGNLFGGPSKRANYIWAIQALFAIFYKKPIIVFCQSVGDNHDFITKKIIKYIFNKAYKIYLRDQESKFQLEKIGVKKEIKVLSDPAFVLNAKNITPQRKQQIIIALREFKNFPEKITEELNKFIKKEGKPSILINFETGVENDGKQHEKLEGKIINFEDNPKDVIDEFTNAELAICMRLHAVIVAIITKTPFIAISYAKKVKAMLQYADLEDLCLNIDELSLENLEKKKKYIEENKELIIGKMQKFKEMSEKILVKEIEDIE